MLAKALLLSLLIATIALPLSVAKERDIERGFPFLPSGCQIVMDRQAQALVLQNIRSQIANRWQQMVAELRSYGDQDLPTFLNESGIELSDILRRGSHSWTRRRRDAGLTTREGSDLEGRLLKRIRAFALQQGQAAGFAAGELLASPRVLGTKDLMRSLFG